MSSLLGAAIERRIPVAAQIDGYATKSARCSPTGRACSPWASKPAGWRIRSSKGAKPADLPVETSEYFLEINLRTAKLIGLDIEDTTLRRGEQHPFADRSHARQIRWATPGDRLARHRHRAAAHSGPRVKSPEDTLARRAS